ncbi:peptidoglycan-binding domain-containing protein [Streptomyces sp. NPDC005251]|uniref:peptidoglycan-binding domain-containing protein n=1 Tax=Streptomyces sp. NPDC005251 TaxID=3157166 RepID=UPI0033B4D56B
MRKHRTAAGLATVAALTVVGAAAAAPRVAAVPISVQVAGASCGYYSGSVTVAYGSTGAPVMEVQCLLKQCGYYAGPVDGSFGPVLTTALKRFQADRGLNPDGIVGPLTWAALRDC